MEAKAITEQQRNERLSDIASKIINGEAKTDVIEKSTLPVWLEAASRTGFKIEEIAKTGEKFPTLDAPNDIEIKKYLLEGKQFPLRAIMAKVSRKNCVAISIERQQGGVIESVSSDLLRAVYSKLDDLLPPESAKGKL